MAAHRMIQLGVVVIALSAGSAAALSDSDADVVPDQFDNCSVVRNGPNEGSNQIDSDGDGYGNACDTDYDDSEGTNVADYGLYLPVFGTEHDGEFDHDGSGTVTVADFAVIISRFSAPPGAPGPSGPGCAGTALCTVYRRNTLNPGNFVGPVDSAGIRNEVRSGSDYQIVTFAVPPGPARNSISLELEVGAPGGGCTNGVQCLADEAYRLVGWADLAAAVASPLAGDLFDLDVTGIVAEYGSSNGGDPQAPRFPTSLLSLELPGFSGFTCPASGCVVALIADVSAGPELTVEARTRSPQAEPGPVDRALCPLGCGGGLSAGTASARMIVAP